MSNNKDKEILIQVKDLKNILKLDIIKYLRQLMVLALIYIKVKL